MPRRPCIVVPTQEDESTRAVVREAVGTAAELVFLPETGEERRRLLEAADGLLVFAWRVAEDELALLSRARVVQSVWAGTDRIPEARLAAAHPGIVVAGGSGPNAPQVAEHAVGLYLDVAKRISWRDRALRAGRWMQDVPGRRVAGTRIAVVGYGAIGGRVGRALTALDARVTAVNRTGSLRSEDARTGAQEATTLEALRERLADHAGVVLALPLTHETREIVDRSWLEAMPQDGILVNVARGRLIDQAALLAHLETHPAFGAGLDTWWRYPRGDASDAPEEMRPFLRLDNVVATPHSAFNVPGARDEMIRSSTARLLRALKGPVREGQ